MTFLNSQQAYGRTTGTTPTGAPVITNRNPTPNDVLYPIGQTWINTVSQTNYYLNDQTSAGGNLQSDWVLYGAGASPLATLTGDSGGAVTPVSNNINVLGGGGGAIAFSNGGAGNLDAQVLVDGTTIAIVGNQLTVTAAAIGIVEIDGNTGSVTGSVVTLTSSGDGTANFNGSGSGMQLSFSNINQQLGLGALSLAFSAGTGNSSYGYLSMSNISGPGSFNTTIGYLAGIAYGSTESNNALFASQGVIGESNTLRLGDQGSGQAQVNTAYIAGVYGVSIDSPNQVVIGSNGQLGSVPGAGSGFSAATWTVSPNAGEGDFTTIAAAIAAASAGDDVLIKTGTYTEDLTLKAGVNLVAWAANGQTPLVTVIGAMTFSAVGSVSLSGIRLQTAADYCFKFTGTDVSTVNFTNCFINAPTHHAFSFTNTNAGSVVNLNQCNGLGSVNNSLFESISVSTMPGTINFVSMNFKCGGFAYLVRLDAATVNITNSYIEAGFDLGNIANFYNSTINTTNSPGAIPQVRTENASTATISINNCVFIGNLSGPTEACISLGGSTVTCTNTTLITGDSGGAVSMSNGGAVFNYAGLVFPVGSGFNISSGTINLLDSTPSNAASGYVWTSTGTDTSPTWQPASGGGGGLTWSDQTASFIAAPSKGYFITASSVIATLPVITADGVTIAFYAAFGGGGFVIQADVTNAIQYTYLATSTNGNLTNQQIGDTVTLVSQLSTGIWRCYASNGTWLVSS